MRQVLEVRGRQRGTKDQSYYPSTIILYKTSKYIEGIQIKNI